MSREDDEISSEDDYDENADHERSFVAEPASILALGTVLVDLDGILRGELAL